MKKILVALLLALFASALSAVSQTQQALPNTKIVVLRAAHMLDVKSGRTIDNPVIVITGEKISAISGPTPAAATVIDLPGATLVPGLIDAHTHLIGQGTHFGYDTLGVSTPMETLWGARNAKVTLEAGFTTVRNVGASGYSDVALRDAINQGLVPGPRMLVSGLFSSCAKPPLIWPMAARRSL